MKTETLDLLARRINAMKVPEVATKKSIQFVYQAKPIIDKAVEKLKQKDQTKENPDRPLFAEKTREKYAKEQYTAVVEQQER